MGRTTALGNGLQNELPRNPISGSSATEDPTSPGPSLCALLPWGIEPVLDPTLLFHARLGD